MARADAATRAPQNSVGRDEAGGVEVATTRERSADQQWLIPPRVSPDGSDCLGRGLDRASVAFAVAGDRTVLREREALGNYLDATYRDPDAAKARLGEIVHRDGHTSVAERLSADPSSLGELRGRTGLFASRAAREERATAEQVWGAIGPAVDRIGEAEAKAERAYRTRVEAQLAADRTGVPRLSERAQAAVRGSGGAEEQTSRAEAWRSAQQDEKVAAELTAFTAAVQRRFGEDGTPALLRAQQPGAKPFDGGPSVAPEQREAVAEVGRTMWAIKAGQGATERRVEAERISMRASQGARLSS